MSVVSESSARTVRRVPGRPRAVDEFLEFASGRARPATVRAYAHDLSVFFGVIGKEPAEVTPKDVLHFVTAERRPRRVLRTWCGSDGESGMSASTIKRRLAAVSSLYGYLVIRGDAGVVTNPVPRGLPLVATVTEVSAVHRSCAGCGACRAS